MERTANSLEKRERTHKERSHDEDAPVLIVGEDKLKVGSLSSAGPDNQAHGK